jgi:hypothetical protein
LPEAIQNAGTEFLTFWSGLPGRLSLNPNRKPALKEPMTLRQLQKKISKDFETKHPHLSEWVSKKLRVADLKLPSQEIGAVQDVFEGLLFCIASGFSSSVNANPYLFDLFHVFSLSRSGGRIKGGMTAYRSLLLNIARRQGVHIPLNTECKRIFIEKENFIGVQVSNRGNMISARGGVLGCSYARASQQMVFGSRSWYPHRRKKATPSGWKFTVALTVHKEAIPNKIMKRSVWKEANAPSLEIEIVDPSDYNGNRSDQRVIYLRTVMPYSTESLNTRYQRITAARMLRKLTEIIPFIEFHVIQIYPDFRMGSDMSETLRVIPEVSASTPQFREDELKVVFGFSSLEEIPDNLLVYQDENLTSETGIDGLFRVSSESYPGLGSLGPIVAGLEAVSWLAHRSGLAGPFG